MTEPAGKPLTEAHYAAIGRVVTTWSVFESTLRLMAYALTTGLPIDEGDDKTAAVVFEGMATRTLTGILVSLVQMRFPEHEKGIRKFGKRIHKAKELRDILCHSMFERGSKPGTIRPMKVKTVGGLKRFHGDFAVEEIEDCAEENGHLAALTLVFLVKWGYFTLPDNSLSPETPA